MSEEEGTKKMCPGPDMLCKGPEAYMLSDGTFDKGLFYFLAKYVKHYYGETYIKNWLANEKGKCYLSMITVDDIAYSILLIKNSAHVWRQDYEVKQLSTEEQNKYKDSKNLRLRRSDRNI